MLVALVKLLLRQLRNDERIDADTLLLMPMPLPAVSVASAIGHEGQLWAASVLNWR